jgi:hypothetical protein
MGQERWSSIWDGRRRPPLAAYPRLVGAGRTSPPIWPCSGWGLPCHHCYQWCGGLLPHRFTLTLCSLTLAQGGLFSVALSVALRRPGVTWQPTRWSSDFPRASCGSFLVCSHTERLNQAGFCPLALREISVLTEPALVHLPTSFVSRRIGVWSLLFGVSIVLPSCEQIPYQDILILVGMLSRYYHSSWKILLRSLLQSEQIY